MAYLYELEGLYAQLQEMDLDAKTNRQEFYQLP